MSAVADPNPLKPSILAVFAYDDMSKAAKPYLDVLTGGESFLIRHSLGFRLSDGASCLRNEDDQASIGHKFSRVEEAKICLRHMSVIDAFCREVLGIYPVDAKENLMIAAVGSGDVNLAKWFYDEKVAVFGGNNPKFIAPTQRDATVVWHEFAHPIADRLGLRGDGISGALNEMWCDLVAISCLHHQKRATAVDFDQGWLLGTDLYPCDDGTTRGLRSISNPGNPYQLEKVPDELKGYTQVGHCSKFRYLKEGEAPDEKRNDHGHVHANSGIPARAFALIANNTKTASWEVLKLFYQTLKSMKYSGDDERLEIEHRKPFFTFATQMLIITKEADVTEEFKISVTEAWKTVGVFEA